MKLVGLTGGIGMGKSTVAACFARARIPVFDADLAVHRLQGPGGRALRPIEAAFPGTVRNNHLDRAALRQAVLGRPEALRVLERIVHPMVREEESRLVARARRAGARAVVLSPARELALQTASVLKQLAAYVGVENFLAGLRSYFADHAYGNTTLSDLLSAVEASSGRGAGDVRQR